MNRAQRLICCGVLALSCASGAKRATLPATKAVPQEGSAEPELGNPSGVLWRSVTLSGDGVDDSPLGLQRHLLKNLVGANWYAALKLGELDLSIPPSPDLRYSKRTGASPAKLEVTADGGRRLMRAVFSRPARLPLPELWREALTHWMESERRAHLCRAWRKAFEEACPEPLKPQVKTPEGESVRSTLTRLIAKVSLRSLYKGGVPTDQAGAPLRPLTVRVESSEGEGVPDVPLRLVRPGESNGTAQSSSMPRGAAVTNAEGIASWDSTVFPNTVRLDTARLLGPLARHWPAQELTIISRPVSVRRWALMVNEVSKGQLSANPVVEAELSRQLLRRGASPKRSLPKDLALILDRSLKAPPSEGQRAERTFALTEIGEGLYGAVDVVLWVDVDSRYAGPMGPNRVWFEARGRLRAYEVWRGIELADVEQTATVSGIGEERADFGARKALTEALVGELLRLSEIRL